NWTTEGETTENPFGPAEKCAGKLTTEWFDGRFGIVRRLEAKCSSSGDVRQLDSLAYDAAAKQYTWYFLDNQGSTGLGKGSIADDTLTMNWDVPAKGKVHQVRGTLKGLGTAKFSWRQEYSEDGKTWKTYFNSTDTKSK